VDAKEFERRFAQMEAAAVGDLDAPEHTRRADLRYKGQSFELTVEADPFEKLEHRFHQAHERRYGYRMEDEAVELVNLRLISTVPVEKPELAEPEAGDTAEAGERRPTSTGSGWRCQCSTAKRWARVPR